MSKQSLGIDIGEHWIAGVVLDRQRGATRVSAHRSLPLLPGAGLVDQVGQLCQDLGWKEGVCVCGLPLSLFSIRNLSLPFEERGMIDQALPFELEEQLLEPVDRMSIDFAADRSGTTGSRIAAFAAPTDLLADMLEETQGVVDPQILTPAIVPLAVQVARLHREQESLLLLHADHQALNLALILEGRPVFYRRLPYPEELFFHPVRGDEEDSVMAEVEELAARNLSALCRAMVRSLDYYFLEHRMEGRLSQALLTGPFAAREGLATALGLALGLPVTPLDLLTAHGIHCEEPVRGTWQPQGFNQALALAWQGLEKKVEINLRKGALAPQQTLLTQARQYWWAGAAAGALCLVLAGLLLHDYRGLKGRDEALRREMTAIYKQTFPEVTKVQDPYTEMRARMKKDQGSDAPAPLFLMEKRALGVLADISVRIPENVSLQVSRLALDREAVTIRGTTDTYNAVDAMKQALAASPRYKTVQIVSATTDKERKNGGIRFELQLQLEGP